MAAAAAASPLGPMTNVAAVAVAPLATSKAKSCFAIMAHGALDLVSWIAQI